MEAEACVMPAFVTSATVLLLLPTNAPVLSSILRRVLPRWLLSKWLLVRLHGLAGLSLSLHCLHQSLALISSPWKTSNCTQYHALPLDFLLNRV
eukprot:365490-Chlamydomonas_euryale.AAC.14